MKVQGSCHCGQIAYEAEVDPATVTICHCTDCQTLSGSAYRVSVPATAGSFRSLRGAPRRYVKTADSGRKRLHAFCGDCGAPMFATTNEGTPASYTLRVGSLAQRAQLPPQRRIWCDSALPWSKDVSGIPGVGRQ